MANFEELTLAELQDLTKHLGDRIMPNRTAEVYRKAAAALKARSAQVEAQAKRVADAAPLLLEVVQEVYKYLHEGLQRERCRNAIIAATNLDPRASEL